MISLIILLTLTLMILYTKKRQNRAAVAQCHKKLKEKSDSDLTQLTVDDLCLLLMIRSEELRVANELLNRDDDLINYKFRSLLAEDVRNFLTTVKRKRIEY